MLSPCLCIVLSVFDNLKGFQENCYKRLVILIHLNYVFFFPLLTIRGPCIVTYSYNKTKEMH